MDGAGGKILADHLMAEDCAGGIVHSPGHWVAFAHRARKLWWMDSIMSMPGKSNHTILHSAANPAAANTIHARMAHNDLEKVHSKPFTAANCSTSMWATVSAMDAH